MPGRDLPLGRYRLLVRTSLLGSVALVAYGLYAALQAQWNLALLAVGAGILLLWPSHYFGIQAQAGSENLLIFITKRDCPLCDEARILLSSLMDGTPFRLEERDVGSDRFLRRHFKNDVPVLLWQGEVLAKLRFDLEGLKERLAQILEERTPRPAPPETRQQSP